MAKRGGIEKGGSYVGIIVDCIPKCMARCVLAFWELSVRAFCACAMLTVCMYMVVPYLFMYCVLY